ncbi:hypothetical protein ACFU93_30455 [Streptomyces sp. NPDC057611]|uniref:hypothetical protein n=1 Tax=Streptomyces sp. NPDC057611 TaxID=3346182 RepID=UPI0036752BD1
MLGWGLADLLGLPTASFIALVLVASSPGGPFGVKLAMVQNADVVAGAAMQVLLAAIGSRESYALSPQYGVGATTGVAWAAADRRNAIDEREGLVTAPSDLCDSAWWPTRRTGAWTLAAVRCLGSRCEDVAGGDG